MHRYHYPTNIILGEGALTKGIEQIKSMGIRKPLLVTDKTLVQLGLVDEVLDLISQNEMQVVVFDGTHPNPVEDDVLQGAEKYRLEGCDALLALGGGSPMDVAKAIAILVNHPLPLEQYDDAKGGDQNIDGSKLPPIFAIATTAGTGSEVGRSAVIILKSTNLKTILFHPKLLPFIAILDPQLLVKLPAPLTAATGLDALTHNLEAYWAPGFHPMADGIAKEGLSLIMQNLSQSVKEGTDLNSRKRMLIASTMGATAFQKGLGMIHSMAHPLSSECGLHHGLANALALPACVELLETHTLNHDQQLRLNWVTQLFAEHGYNEPSLSKNFEKYFSDLGIQLGLRNHGVKEEQLSLLAKKAFADGCHQSNMVPVSESDFLKAFKRAF
ncbi:MAG: iron-containing alcohol dehydrogenase [Bdellovibrionales bacterium]|nr:iron-containing alcohol dehydrogenase [Bdellovibrionales bacterium]